MELINLDTALARIGFRISSSNIDHGTKNLSTLKKQLLRRFMNPRMMEGFYL